MTYGFTPRQAYNLFRSIRKEVFPDWGIPPQRIQFSALPFTAHGWPVGFGGLASTLFDTSHPLKPAYGMVVDGAFLPYMYEDELRGTILHEIAHIIAGWDADHDEEWAYVCNLLGTPPSPYCILREWQRIPKDIFDPDEDLIREAGGPTYG